MLRKVYMYMRGNRGFTLVELLAVMAIIVILIGFLTPAITSARKQARKIECLSNLRQIAVAINSYAMDNQGDLPTGITDAILGAYFDTDVVPTCPELGAAETSSYTLAIDDGTKMEAHDSDEVLVHDSSARHSGDTWNVLYIDGHVETTSTDPSAAPAS